MTDIASMALAALMFALGLFLGTRYPWKQLPSEDDEAETDRFLIDLGRTYREELARKIADEAERQYVNTPLQPGFLRAASFHDLVYQAASKILSTE